MIIACITLSSLALLATGVNLILFFVEKKRDTARRQAMLDYVNNRCDSAIEENEAFTKDYATAILEKEKDSFKAENSAFISQFSEQISERFAQQQSDIEKLKSGACPNYEAALAAANAVNDFNAGISAIMNFDPIEAARARRRGGDKEVS